MNEFERWRCPGFTRDELKHLETRKKSERGGGGRKQNLISARSAWTNVRSCMCSCNVCVFACTRLNGNVSGNSWRTPVKWTQNATRQRRSVFFYLSFFFFFFLGKLLRRYSDSFAQAFQVRFTDIVPEILLCVRPSIDHFSVFFFSLLRAGTSGGPETSLCARDWTSRESIETACFRFALSRV